MTHFIERFSMYRILSKLHRRRRRTTKPDKPLTEDPDIPHQSDLPSPRPKKTWLSRFRGSLDKLRSWRRNFPFRRRRSSQPPVQASISSPHHTIALPTVDEMQEVDDEVLLEERVAVIGEESGPEREPDVAIDPLQESVSLTRSSSLVLLPDLLSFSFSSSELSLGSSISSSRPGTPVASIENLGNSSLNPNSIEDLPIELLDVIFNLVLESELCPTRGNHVLLRNVRHVCRRWKALGEEILWRSLRTSGGLFTKDQHSEDPDDLVCRRKLRTDLREWYAQGSRRLRSFGTVSATSDVVENIQDLDTGYLRTVFHGLARCSRADIKILVERATSLDNVQPGATLPPTPNRDEDSPWTLNLSHLSPCIWPFLVDLSLMCPLSVEDAYFALVGGCDTLKRVSIGTIKANTNLREPALVSSSPSIPASRVTLGSLESLSIQAYSDTNNLFTKFHFPTLTTCLLSIPSRSTMSFLLGDPASVSGSSQCPALLTDLEHLWGGLTTFSLDTEEVLQRADLVDIFLKCDKLTNLTWKGRSTSSAPRHISSTDNARLDSFWKKLTHLSLESEDRDAWPLTEAVKKCDALESLEWKGLQSDLSENDLTPRSFRNLSRLVVEFDEATFSTIFQMATRLVEVTIPSGLCTSLDLKFVNHLKLKTLTVINTIPVSDASRIMNIIQDSRILHAVLQVAPETMLHQHHLLSNRALRHLTLLLPTSDQNSLALLMDRMLTPSLQQLDLLLPEKILLGPDVWQPFLKAYNKSIKEISCIAGVPRNLPKTKFTTNDNQLRSYIVASTLQIHLENIGKIYGDHDETSITYPMVINELPPEVLSEIFVAATNLVPIRREIQKGYIVRRSHKWEPLKLVHVCRYWREVALSMQTLWTSIDATEFKPEALTHWLSFAKMSPLHLAYWPMDGFECGEPVEEKTLKKSQDVLRQFPLCADRWDSLYFRVQNVELTEAIAKMLETSASRSPLQSFEIDMAHDDTPPKVVETLTSAISSFPSLRHLSWTFNSIQITLPRVIQWHALENVYVSTCIEVEDFIWCLTQCTSARTVTFRGIGREKKRRVTNTFDNVQCILPNLESLTINEHCDPYRLLQHFTIPSLVYLEIRTVYGTSNALQDFLARSQCPLQTFKLDVADMKKEDVVGCLLTPYLRSVSNVIALLFVAPEPYLADIVQWRPDILRILPKLTAWLDMTGYNIGWKRSGKEVVKF